MTKEDLITIRKGNDATVDCAKQLIVGRIAALVNQYYDGVMDYSPKDKRVFVNLDTYNESYDGYVLASYIVVSIIVRNDMPELYYRDPDEGEIVVDSLIDLSLGDCERILYFVEKQSEMK